MLFRSPKTTGLDSVRAMMRGLGEIVDRLGQLAEKGAADFAATGESAAGDKGFKGVYGFSVKVGRGGSGVRVEPFGNLRRDRQTGEAAVHEVREPVTDVFEEPGGILIVAEMPGVSAAEVKLEIAGDVLTLKAAAGQLVVAPVEGAALHVPAARLQASPRGFNHSQWALAWAGADGDHLLIVDDAAVGPLRNGLPGLFATGDQARQRAGLHRVFAYGVLILACLALVALFSFLILRGLWRINESSDRFVQLAATGLVAEFGLQALINMAVNLNLIPTKGMTLPFISYGGSSAMAVALSTWVACMAAMAALASSRLNRVRRMAPMARRDHSAS